MADQLMTAALPPIEHAAKQEYEYYGSTLTTNTALKLTVVILAGVIAALAFALVRTAKAAVDVKPLVIRVNEVGRADAIAYQDLHTSRRHRKSDIFLLGSSPLITHGITRPWHNNTSTVSTF
ncbi:MAG: hypothetical protein ACR2IV_07440 [Bryobacteraceae bacterium]